MKAYNRPKKSPTSTSQIIAWQEQQDSLIGVLTTLQKRLRNGLEKIKAHNQARPSPEKK